MIRVLLFLISIFFIGINPALAYVMSPETGYGPHPVLPDPSNSLLPTIHEAEAVGWPAGVKPVAALGLSVQAFAGGLDHPRWIYVLPNGDVLVAETNAPPKPDDSKGIKGFVMGLIMKNAGAGTKSANRISLLRDADHDGKPDLKTTFLQGLNSPFGMTLVGGNFYVADTDAVLRFPYHTGDTQITVPGEKLVSLPAGTINHHWTKNLVASPDGKYLYVSVGSNSNAGENGIDKETNRAAIHQIDLSTGSMRLYASGLRNPVGMGFEPMTKTLWVSVNERDELGDDLVPDYMTSVKDGGFYGWPYVYYGGHIDRRIDAPNLNDIILKTSVPDYALGAHTASLGFTFYNGTMLPAHYKGGAFVSQHGSWNRSQRVGYKVIFIPFVNGQPSGMPEDVLSGFLNEDDKAMGRPVGVAVDSQGALLVADDVGNVIWRVSAP